MAIAAQVHDRFKLFAGTLDADGHPGALAASVAKWAAAASVAPKSIGIEFVESTKQLILSVGYRDDEPGYAVTLASTKIGKLGALDPGELERLEAALATAAASARNVICHELYVTDANELYVVTMSHA